MRFKNFMVLSIVLCMYFNLFAQDIEKENLKNISVNLEKGIQYFKNREYEKAKVFFIEKVKKNKNDAIANHYLGRTYFFLQKNDKAIEYLEKAIKINSQNAEYH